MLTTKKELEEMYPNINSIEIARGQHIIETYFSNEKLPDGEYKATITLENGFYVTHIKRIDKKKIKWWEKLFWGLVKNA